MNKNKIAYILYLLFLILLCLAGGEIWAKRNFQKTYLATNIQKDRTFHHLLQPHTKGSMSSQGDFDDFFVTNNKGMRGPADYTYEKREGTFRIAVMGDSFTFGMGVKAEETYSFVLQKLLAANIKGRFEVLNFGVSSFSPVLEYLYLKKEVTRYKPDMLILSLDLCDLQDDYFYEQHLVYSKDGEITACDPYRYKGGPDVWAIMKDKFALAAFLDEKLFQSVRKMNTLGFVKYFYNKIHKIRNKTEILTNTDIDNIDFDRFLFTREDKKEAVVLKHWQRTQKYLSLIKKLCDENSIKFVLVAYPYGHEVGTNQWAKGREYWAFDKNKTYDATRVFRLIRAYADEKNIPFVSLLEPMKLHSSKILYYNNDGHWTAEGQKLAGETLFERIFN